MFRADPCHTGVNDDGGTKPSGTLAWSFTTGDRVYSSPAVVDGVVYIGSDDKNLYALDAETGAGVWNYTTGGRVLASPAIDNGIVYIGSYDKNLYALDKNNGSLLWVFPTGGWVTSSPVVAGGVVYSGSLDDRLYAIDAVNGTELWNISFGEYPSIDSSPAVCNGLLYVTGGQTTLYALDTLDGTEIWNFTTDNPISSSPAVAEGILYVSSWDGNAYALDAITGQEIWRSDIGSESEMDSSPAVADGVVYIGSNDNNVYALDAFTGDKIWNYTTGNVVYSSPTIANGVVYVGSWDYAMYALDADTGEEIWNYTTGSVVYSSPAVSDGLVYFGSFDGNVYALGAEPEGPPESISGLHAADRRHDRITWNWTDPEGAGFSHVMVYLDGMFRENVTKGMETFTATGLSAATSYTVSTRTVGTNGQVNETWVNNTAWTVPVSSETAWKFRSDLSNSGVYDDGGKRPEGDLLWKFPTGRMIRSAPAIVDGILYFGSEDGTFYAIDPATGSLLWDHPMPGGPSSGLQSSPAVANGIAYVGSWDGNLFALDAATGAPLWSYAAGDSVLSSPAVADGVVYFGSRDRNLYALNASGGNLLWNYTTGAEVVSSPALANDIVYFGSYDKNLYALDTSTGTLLWNYTTGGEVRSSPAVADGVVYFGSDDTDLYALDASTGNLLWNYTTGAEVRSSPAVVNGVVYFGSYDENFYALDAATGALLWSYAAGDSVYSSPAVANGVVYFGNLWESFFALDASTGVLLWQYTLPETMIFSSPAVAQGTVFVGMDDGNLYAFGSFPDDPPASVTDLHATTTQQLTITWAWTDPNQIGFSHVMVYLDGVFQENVTKGTETWTITGLSPSTSYTIGTRTVGEKGLINQTWVNNTATTGSLSIASIDPPEVMEGSPAFALNVYGTGFTTTGIILWNGDEQTTQYLDSGHVRVDIPAELVARPRYVNITAYESQSGGWSNPAYLIVADIPSVEKAWKFRSDLKNSGVYDDGGARPEDSLLWYYPTGGPVSSSPAVADGVVYIGSQDSNLYAFDASSGEFLWKYNTSEQYDWVSSSPAVADGVVYIGGLKTKIHAIDAATGSPLWNFTVPAGHTARISVSSSPAVANGIVYIGSYDGNLYAFNTSSGVLLWTYTTAPGNNVFSSPAVVNGIVYFGSRDSNNFGHGGLYALDAVTGNEIWTRSMEGYVDSSPAVTDGVVYAGCSDHNIYAFDAYTGALQWNYTTGGTVASSPAVADGAIYVGSMDNVLYALDAPTGALRWKYTTGGNITSSPAVANGIVYFGSYDNNTYALNASTGSLFWRHTTENIVRSSPAVTDGVVYFGSYDRGVYAIGTRPVIPPVANFTANETLGFVPLSVQFIDSSTGSPLAYQWDFGDGSQNATEQNPVHAYTARGTYNVTLTVSNGAGTNSFERPWYIHAMDSLPPIGGDKAYYLVHSNVDGAEVYFNGDWFEGTIENGTLLVQTCTSCTPVWTYTVKKCGYFTLTQNNTRYPAKDEVVDLYANLTAPKEPLIADFTTNITEGTAPLTVGFESHSVGIAQTWNWSFGDGTYSEEENPVHTYTAAGIYTVSLHETNSACQNNTMVKPDYIRVGGTPLFKADFTVSPVTGDAPLTVRCTDNSIGNPTMIVYNFGDGFTAVGSDVAHTYRFPGTYTITQTISKYDTATRTFMKSVARKPDAVTVFRAITPPPEAAFTASPVEGPAPLAVAFRDESSGNPTYYTYDFGDGFKSTSANPVHTYQFPGTYEVKLTILRIGTDFASLQSAVTTGTIVVTGHK